MKKTIIILAVMISMFSLFSIGAITDDIPGDWSTDPDDYILFYDFESANVSALTDNIGMDYSNSDYAQVNVAGWTYLWHTVGSIITDNVTACVKMKADTTNRYYQFILQDALLSSNMVTLYKTGSGATECSSNTGLLAPYSQTANTGTDSYHITCVFHNGTENGTGFYRTLTGWTNTTGKSSGDNAWLVYRGYDGTAYFDWIAIFSGFSHPPETFNASPTNLQFNVFKEYNNEIINEQVVNLTLVNTDIPISYLFYTSNGVIRDYAMPGNYTVLINSPDPIPYEARSYNIIAPSVELNNYSFYLTVGSTVIFSFTDISSNEILEGVRVRLYKLVGSEWQIMEDRYTDVTGRVQFSYDPYTKYKIVSEIDGYETKTVTFDQILFSTYNVRMTKETTSIPDYDDVSIYWNPKSFQREKTYTFQFLIDSPNGLIDYYNYSLNYPCGVIDEVGTGDYGGAYETEFTVSCGSYLDHVNLTIYYDLSTGSMRSFTYQYPLIVNQTFNHTFISNRDVNYGLGDFTRYTIAILSAIVIGGTAVMFAGELIGIGLAIFILGYFSLIGFISIYPTIISIIIGVFYIIGRR